MQGEHSIKRRKRGIKASRVKLEKALINAGFKTQMALAEHIAELEQLETIPKDIVNRVFREQTVSLHTLERIAQALNVEAYSLYLTSDEVNVTASTPILTNTRHNPENLSEPENKSGNKFNYLVVSVIVLIMAWLWVASANDPSRDADKVSDKITLPELLTKLPAANGRYSTSLLVAQPLKNQAKQFNSALTSFLNITPSIHVHDTLVGSIRQLEQELQVDFVISQTLQTYGRYWLVETWLHHNSEEKIIDRRYFIDASFNHQSDDYYRQLASKLQALINDGVMTEQLQPSYSLEYGQYLLTGLSLLDESNNPDKVKSAQSRFLLAKDINSNNALAYAGLCLAYLYESWSGNEKKLLEQAGRHCSFAKSQSPNLPIVVAANGFLMRRTGQLEQAKVYLEQYLQHAPDNALVLLELGSVYLETFRQQGQNKSLLTQAKHAIEQSIVLEPNHWKSYFNLGVIAWIANEQRAAVTATTLAAKYSDNDLVIGNLTAFSLCVGDLELAKKYINQALQKNSQSYLSLENMSMLHYFSHEFSLAVDFRLKAIASAGDVSIHQMWGALADAHFFNNQLPQAIQIYQKALQLVERDYARGNQTLSDQVFRYYYLIRLSLLSSQTHSLPSETAADLIELSAQIDSLDTAAISRLALSFHYLKEYGYRDQVKLAAIERCPVYEKLPEWQ